MKFESWPKYTPPHVTTEDYIEVHHPPVLAWNVHLTGQPRGSVKGMVFFTMSRAPNRFHRFMQWLLLGIYWEKRT